MAGVPFEFSCDGRVVEVCGVEFSTDLVKEALKPGKKGLMAIEVKDGEMIFQKIRLLEDALPYLQPNPDVSEDATS